MPEVDFVVEDYKLALSYLEGQFQRLWQRFNFFLAARPRQVLRACASP